MTEIPSTETFALEQRRSTISKTTEDNTSSTQISDTLTTNLQACVEIRQRYIQLKRDYQKLKAKIIAEHGEQGTVLLQAIETIDDFRDFYTYVS